MKAVIMATGYNEKLKPLINFRPTPLLNVLGKPALFYVLDFLVRRKFRHCILILSWLPEQIEAKVREGKRWGLDITYYLVRDPNMPFGILSPAAHSWGDEKILIGQGDSLPYLDSYLLDEGNFPKLYYLQDGSWTGWGCFQSFDISKIPLKSTLSELPSLMHQKEKIICEPCIDLSTMKTYLDSNVRCLKKGSGERLFLSTSRSEKKDIWISRGAVIPPSVKIEPPVFIGEDCHIDQKAHIGPNAIVEHDCVIDRGSQIKNSLICQRSYVGEDISVSDSIVDRNVLIDLKNETLLIVNDDFILSELPDRQMNFTLYPLFERLLALFIWISLIPIYCILLLVDTFEIKEIIYAPAKNSNTTFFWQAFKKTTAFRHLPLILEIVYGNIHFVGISPREKHDFFSMPEEWKKVYLSSKLGLITLADLDYLKDDQIDQRYASEAYYAVHSNFIFDCKLFLRWIRKKVNL